jgi:hypothetical protein
MVMMRETSDAPRMAMNPRIPAHDHAMDREVEIRVPLPRTSLFARRDAMKHATAQAEAIRIEAHPPAIRLCLLLRAIPLQRISNRIFRNPGVVQGM